MKNNKEKLLKVLKKGKDKVVDVASDILSAPSRYASHIKTKNADYKYNKIMSNRKQKEMFREMDRSGVVDKGNESDPLFRYRLNAINEAFDKELQRKKDEASSLKR